MGYLFKHLAVRLWAALVAGSLAALVVLPPFAGAVGPGWMILPGLGLLVAAYWLSGMAFAAMGRRRLERLLGEATVWDRAGMSREVRQALAKAAATVDSFFFSPLSRRVPARRLLSQMGRFQLAQVEPGTSFDAIVGAYLHAFPRDRDAAIKWLDGVLAGRAVTRQSHDIAARIGAAHPEDTAIVRMLAQFYLAERRCDFAALQAYRQLVEAGEPLSDTILRDLSDLFLTEPRADHLALMVYLDAHERGGRDPRLLPGVAACCRMIHPSPLNLPLLQRADEVLAGIDASRRSQHGRPFFTRGDRFSAQDDRPRGRRIRWAAVGPIVRQHVDRLEGRLAGRGYRRRCCQPIATNPGGIVVPSGQVGGEMGGHGAVHDRCGMAGGQHRHASWAKRSHTVEKAPVPVVAPVTDPFTLQVAAYLKEIRCPDATRTS
jgi:hypothetical protein